MLNLKRKSAPKFNKRYWFKGETSKEGEEKSSQAQGKLSPKKKTFKPRGVEEPTIIGKIYN